MLKLRSRLTRYDEHRNIRRKERSGAQSGETYQVLVDDMALEVVVPAVVEALLAHEVADVDVAEACCVGEEGARRRFPRPRRPRH